MNLSYENEINYELGKNQLIHKVSSGVPLNLTYEKKFKKIRNYGALYINYLCF